MSEPLAPQPSTAPAAAPTSNLAIVSLVAGIVSWFIVPILGAIVAVISGHMAKNEIRGSGGRLSGDGLATAGLFLGYLQPSLTLIGACVVAVFVVLGISAPLMCLPFANEWTSLLGG